MRGVPARHGRCFYGKAARGPDLGAWEVDRRDWWQSRGVEPPPAGSDVCQAPPGAVVLGDDMFADEDTAELAFVAAGSCAAYAEAVARRELAAAVAFVRPPWPPRERRQPPGAA